MSNCQLAKDYGMEGHSCAGECAYKERDPTCCLGIAKNVNNVYDSSTPTGESKMFAVNQIVAGKFGQFVILGFRTIDGEDYAQVKSYNPTTGKAARGEMALPLSVLKAI